MDLGYIVLSDNPPEWADTVLDPELIELLQPDPQTGMLPFWSAAVYRAVDMDRWYLLRNEDRLSAPSGVETFITKMGIEWPHRGALRLYSMYEDSIDERGLVHGEQVRYQRTITKMRRRGRHEPISIDHAYTNWMRARQRLQIRSDSDAERLLGPMPKRHIRDGWPVGMKERIIATNILHIS